MRVCSRIRVSVIELSDINTIKMFPLFIGDVEPLITVYRLESAAAVEMHSFSVVAEFAGMLEINSHNEE